MDVTTPEIYTTLEQEWKSMSESLIIDKFQIPKTSKQSTVERNWMEIFSTKVPCV